MNDTMSGKRCPCCGMIITRRGCRCDDAERAGIVLPDPALMDHPQRWYIAVADYLATLAMLEPTQEKKT